MAKQMPIAMHATIHNSLGVTPTPGESIYMAGMVVKIVMSAIEENQCSDSPLTPIRASPEVPRPKKLKAIQN